MLPNILENKYTFIVIILLADFVNGLTWIGITPVFEAPDEPEHFCYVQKLAENGALFLDKRDTMYTIETVSAWQLTDRDKVARSNNKYDFIDGQCGVNEKQINDMPVGSRRELSEKIIMPVPVQYPPLYYLYSTIPYYLFYSQNVFARVVAVRIFSLLLGLITFFVIYNIAQLYFTKDQYLPGLITILVCFNPMVSFIFSSVNSDCLLILLFSIFLYYYSKMNLAGLNLKDAVFLALTILLGLLAKQQFALTFMILIFALVFFSRIQAALKIVISLLACACFVVFVIIIIKSFPVPVAGISIGDFMHYIFGRLIPWLFSSFILTSFFGNFGWLSAPIPDCYIRILSVTVWLCVICLIIDFYKSIIGKKSFLSARKHAILYVPICIYIGSIIYVDANTKYGIQGRYLFPIISLIYICLLSGLLSIIPKKLHLNAGVILAIVAVCFNAICLFTVLLPRFYL